MDCTLSLSWVDLGAAIVVAFLLASVPYIMDWWLDRMKKLAAAQDQARRQEVTSEMVREMFAHVPFEVSRGERYAYWGWCADFLNRAIAEPNKPCECCGVTPNGDVTGS